jgi:hypothetical protein
VKYWERIALLLGLGFVGFLSLQPIFPDPYYHKEKVNFWTWAYREIDELLHGEKE